LRGPAAGGNPERVIPRLVILDFDGTLADSWPWLLGALDETAMRFRLRRITAEQAEALRGRETMAVLQALGVAPWQVPRIAAHLRRRVLAAPPPPLFPGMAELLTRLAAHGVRLAIASSNTEAQVARTLGPDLLALVAHRALEAGLFGKAAKLRRILRDSAVPPEAAISIGDELRDIEAARSAGIAAGAVAWGYATRDLLAAHRPDAIFDAPADIAAFCRA
jgi:phosphoglycolate phosphatase